MNDEKTTTPKKLLESAVKEVLQDNIEALIRALKNEAGPAWLTEQLKDAKGSPDLLRELFRLWVLDPVDENEGRVQEARKYLGWKVNAADFNGLKPEFLDVIYLLPPRNYAIVETLAPLLEHRITKGLIQPKNIEIKKLFDIGTGTGLLMRILRKAGIKGKMLGIDPAADLADFASQKFSRSSESIKIEVNRIQNFYKLHTQFEMALCYMVLHHVCDENAEYQNALKKIFEALLEGGTFVYTDKLCAALDENNNPQPFDFKTASESRLLESGQELEVESSELNSVKPFRPHPEKLPEYHRTWKDVANALSEAGFLIQCAKPLNERVMLFVCRKPYTMTWERFATKPRQRYRAALGKGKSAHLKMGKAPYHWTQKVLQELYFDISGEECPTTFKKEGKGFLRGIAFFSWEKASRLFLVRRAQPFDFHILSYSHVHDGWGTLGRMIEEFEKDPADYTKNKGYSCLTRDAVQRTLPFQGDIEHLNYEAAMAVPIYRNDGYELRGALLLYLAKLEYVPLHTGIELQKDLIERFTELNDLINNALDKQSEKLQIVESAKRICAKWEELAQKKPESVAIARLIITAKKNSPKKRQINNHSLSLSDVCSRIQAQLTGSDCFSVLDDKNLLKGEAAILVAARFGVTYDEIRERILATVGAAAENYGPFIYECKQLGKE
jgi:SAM-dependent methyltransferase